MINRRISYLGSMERKVRITTLKTSGNDLKYWLSRPEAERLAAIELLRQEKLEMLEAKLTDLCSAEGLPRGVQGALNRWLLVQNVQLAIGEAAVTDPIVPDIFLFNIMPALVMRFISRPAPAMTAPQIRRM